MFITIKLFSIQPPHLDVSETILEQLDKNNYVGAVFIDLKKAFDIVDHKILFKGELRSKFFF